MSLLSILALPSCLGIIFLALVTFRELATPRLGETE